jgi:3-(3-hydroxy-phenyl)propionate hydroxylase
LISGGGPVGLFAALVLGRHGIATTVIEADSTVCDGSRAICISRRSLQILERAGVVEAFLTHGLHWQFGNTYLGTEPVFRLSMPQSRTDRYPPFINLQQYRAEQLLVDACVESGLVEILWDTRVVGVDAREHGVEVAIEGSSGRKALPAPWLIACDGARSAVRDALGLKLEGRSYDSRYLIADIEMKCDWPTERKVWFDPASNPRSTVIMHKQPGDVWRIDYQLRADQDSTTELQDENIRRRIAAHLELIGLDCEWRLLWKSLYQARTLSLGQYVHGRVIFAGDAAHLVPIFGVRGLNSGLDDAMNLAWKLACVVGGSAEEEFLQTYNKERRDAYQENIESSVKTTWFMSPPNDGFVVARDAILELATAFPQFRALIDPRQSSFHRYRSAAIFENAECALVGAPLPEVLLRDGSHIHDWLGPQFSVIAISVSAQTIEIRDEASGSFLCRNILVPKGLVTDGDLDLPADQTILVRPDTYVAACIALGQPVDWTVSRLMRGEHLAEAAHAH